MAITRRAGPGGKLHRVVADRAGAAGYQQRLALHRPGDEDAAMRGHARHAQGRALGKRHVVGEFGHQIDRERDVFRRGALPAAVALAVVEPDALAEPALGHAGADLIDDPGAVAVGDDARILHRRRAAPPIGVGRIDAGRLQPHPHLAVAGLRRRQFAADEDLVGRTLPVVPDGAHGGQAGRLT